MTDDKPKRGRPRKATPVPEKGLRVKKPNAIFDGKGGFLAVGAVFAPVDDETAEILKARGLAE